MVAYNFQREFAADILSGSKRSTIRPLGKRRHAVAREQLQIYTGMRTKSCHLLLRAPCLYARPVEIHHWGLLVDGSTMLRRPSIEDLARVDGFASYDALLAWFDNRYGLPVVDMMQIRWDFTLAEIFATQADLGVLAP